MIKEQILKKIENQKLEEKLASLDSIGERLRYLRKKHLKLTRADLSSKIGIEANMINKYENGYFEPKRERIKQFAEFFNIPVEYITGENIDFLIKEDYFLISNLHMYCWEIDNHLISVDNTDEIKFGLYEAAKIVIRILEQSEIDDYGYMYLYSFLQNESDGNVNNISNMNDLLLIFDNKPMIPLYSISAILYFGINIKDALSKTEYREVMKYLKPVIESYYLHNTKEKSL